MGFTRLLSISGTPIKLLKPPEWIKSNRLGRGGSDSLASPLWLDKILLAATSEHLKLQTVTNCLGNCCRLHVKQINSILIMHLAQFIYSNTSLARKYEGWREMRMLQRTMIRTYHVRDVSTKKKHWPNAVADLESVFICGLNTGKEQTLCGTYWKSKGFKSHKLKKM